MRVVALLFVVVLVGAFIWMRRTGEPAKDARPDWSDFDLYEDEFELDPKVADYVWEIERRAHHLQHELCPRLEQGIRTGDPTAWERTFGQATIDEPSMDGTRLDLGFATIDHWESGVPVVPKRLVARLHGFARSQAELDRVHVHICDLSPAQHGKLDGDWSGTWAIELEGRGATGGRVEWQIRYQVHYSSLPAAPADAEAFVSGARLLWWEQRRAPQPLFEEVTDRCGIDWRVLRDSQRDGTKTHFPGTYLLDYDRDGWLDLLVLDPPAHYLYRGIGKGRFEDATLTSNILELPDSQAHVQNATVIDVDNDGYEDLMLDLAIGQEYLPVLFRNQTDGTFKHTTRAVAPTALTGAATVFDFDRDGFVDLFRPSTHAPPDNWKQRARWIGDRVGRESALLRNVRGVHFEDITVQANAGAGPRDVFAAGAADLDLDGDPDLMLANHMGDNVLLINDGAGAFREHAFARSFGGFSMGLALGDIDGDGDADAYVANMSSRAGHRIHGNLRRDDFPPRMYELVLGFFEGDEIMRNDPGPKMEVVEERTNGWAYGPGMADLDGDGRLDVYVPTGFQSVDPHEPDG